MGDRGETTSMLRSFLGPVRESAQARTSGERKVPIESVRPGKAQPRHAFAEGPMRELVTSVEQHGILQPLLVRPVVGGGDAGAEYEIVAGERRYRAAREAGLERVPVVVRELSEEDATAVALIENLQREDLNPVEETEGILQLLVLALGAGSRREVVSLLYRMDREERGTVREDPAHSVMGGREAEIVREAFEGLGKMGWRSFVTNRLPLLGLPEALLGAVREGRLAYTKAVVLARVGDEQLRARLLRETLEEELSLGELRRRVRAASEGERERPGAREYLGQRAARLARTVRRSEAMDDEGKAREVEELLARIEELLGA